MARSSRRNFWDNVRRNRNAQKPHYWEEWTLEKSTRHTSKAEGNNDTTRFYFTNEKPSAAQARSRLKELGLTGNQLSSKVRAIMKDETTIAFVELEIYVQGLFADGFINLPPATHKDGTSTVRFEKYSPSGELEASAQIQFSKSA